MSMPDIKRAGSFPEGTVIVKELTRVLNLSYSRRVSAGSIWARVF